MALSAYEEQLAAEIEADLRVRDESWSRSVDVLVAQLDRERRVRRVLPIICLTAGIALLFAGSQMWLSIQLAILCGLPASLISRAFTVGGYTVMLAAVLLLGRVVYERRLERYAEPRS